MTPDTFHMAHFCDGFVQEIEPYAGPTPPAGVHRYVVSLFLQPGTTRVDVSHLSCHSSMSLRHALCGTTLAVQASSMLP